MFYRSLILSSFLSISSLFAYDGSPYIVESTGAGPAWNPGDMGVDGPLMCSEMELASFNSAIGLQGCDFWFSYTRYYGDCFSEAYSCIPVAVCPAGTTLTSTSIGNSCMPDSCPAGQVIINSSVCGSPNTPLLVDPMNLFNNDPIGCNNAGGYYFMDGSCNGGSEAIVKIFQDPTAVVGALLTVGGVAFSGAGVLALPLSAGGSGLAIGIGANATAIGLGMMGVTAGGMFASTTLPSNDVTSGETRMKVVLTTSGGSSASAGSNVTKTNTTTGKVDQSTFVPDTVKIAMSNSSNVDTTTGTLITPISLAGVETTTFDYVTNTATTVYNLPDSTSAIPNTATTSSSFTVTQNIDGTVTTIPTNSAVAPTVSGSGGGSVVSSATGTTSGTGTGTTTGTGPDYTGVLNDIKTNTGATKSVLDQILSMFDSSTAVDTTLNDGSGDFGALDGDVKDSMSGFVYTDPLGLNSLGGTGGIQSYGFTLYGRHFVVLDQAMIDQLPIDMIKNLFLFIAAVLGLITVVSGV